jgi:hypothetical protein
MRRQASWFVHHNNVVIEMQKAQGTARRFWIGRYQPASFGFDHRYGSRFGDHYHAVAGLQAASCFDTDSVVHHDFMARDQVA